MKTLNLFIALFLFLNIAAAQNSIESYRSTEITDEELYSHISYLASDKLEGRLNGTIGDLLTQLYLAAELEKYGFTPMGDSSYFQNFNLKIRPNTGNYKPPVILKIKGNDIPLSRKEYELLPVSANGTAKGSLILAGYSSPNDLVDSNGNPISISGKVLILFDSVTNSTIINESSFSYYQRLTNKILALKNQSPSGIVVITAEGELFEDNSIHIINSLSKYYINSGIPVMNIRKEIITEMMKTYGFDLEKFLNSHGQSGKPACIDITDSYIEFTDNVIRRDIKTANVIGFLEGSDEELKKEVIVIGAHFDHLGKDNDTDDIFYGADDNASGTSAVLEIAQKLSSKKESLKRSILITFFGAEEGGLNGSNYFIISGGAEKYNIKAMINFDMIGRLRNDSLILFLHDKFPANSETIEEINNNYKFRISYPEPHIGRSDQRSFLNKGIPILAFFNGLHKDYHTPNDTPERINRKGAYRITSFGYEIIYYLCTK